MIKHSEAKVLHKTVKNLFPYHVHVLPQAENILSHETLLARFLTQRGISEKLEKYAS